MLRVCFGVNGCFLEAIFISLILVENYFENSCVRGKSHQQSSRWFLPFFVFYRSIAVSCELSLRLETRTYKNDVRLYCVGFSILAVAEMFLACKQKASVVRPKKCWSQGPELLVLPPSSLLCSLDGPKVCKLARNKKITCLR